MHYGYFDEILDDNEKEGIRMFINNDLVREAVKKALLAGIYQNGTLKKGKKANALYNAALALANPAVNGEKTHDEIGRNLRALWEGINSVESAFSAMSVFKTEETEKVAENPAR